MNAWGRGSQRHLAETHPLLRDVADKVVQLRDHSVIDAHRNKETQNRYFETGVSKVQYPDSYHNYYPSRAIDVQPYPYNEETLREDLSYIAGLYIGIAAEMGLDIRWGGDWDEDGETADNNFDDLFHFELRGDLPEG